MAVVPTSSRSTSSGGAGALTKLFDSTLGADAAQIATGTLPTGYIGWEIAVVARSAKAAANQDFLDIKINGATGAVYSATRANARSTWGNASDTGYVNPGGIHDIPAASSPASAYGTYRMHLLAPDSAIGHQIVSYGGYEFDVANTQLEICSLYYSTIEQITGLTFLCATSGANLKAGSRVTVFGLSAA